MRRRVELLYLQGLLADLLLWLLLLSMHRYSLSSLGVELHLLQPLILQHLVMQIVGYLLARGQQSTHTHR